MEPLVVLTTNVVDKCLGLIMVKTSGVVKVSRLHHTGGLRVPP
jgi:hypothetical protein